MTSRVGRTVRTLLGGAAVSRLLCYAVGWALLAWTHRHHSAETGPTAAALADAYSAVVGGGIGLAIGAAMTAMVAPWFVAGVAGVLGYAGVIAFLFASGRLAGGEDAAVVAVIAVMAVPAGAFAFAGAAFAGAAVHLARAIRPRPR